METQGFECVPYYQCGQDGTIVTDGEGLIDIRCVHSIYMVDCPGVRFGGEGQDPDLAVLDSTDLMCPGR